MEDSAPALFLRGGSEVPGTKERVDLPVALLCRMEGDTRSVWSCPPTQ